MQLKNNMIKQEAITQLLNVKSVLAQIKDEDYTATLTTLKGASIGKHIRHIIEFYECFSVALKKILPLIRKKL
jgi:hypothetical protein